MKTYKPQNALKLLSIKTLFLCMIGILYTGCSKDEKTLMEEVLTNVENTRWLATNGKDSYELTFQNGQYTVECTSNNSKSSATGAYSMNQRKITFEKKIFASSAFIGLKEGTISDSGFMNVTVGYSYYWDDNDMSYILKFTPVEKF